MQPSGSSIYNHPPYAVQLQIDWQHEPDYLYQF